jgi:hypothetical protein
VEGKQGQHRDHPQALDVQALPRLHGFAPSAPRWARALIQNGCHLRPPGVSRLQGTLQERYIGYVNFQS